LNGWLYPSSVKEFRSSRENAREDGRSLEKDHQMRKWSLKKPGVAPSHRATAGADAPGPARETKTRNHMTMIDNILKSLVTEAVSLDREINEKADRLKKQSGTRRRRAEPRT
jgi:hypothetical protein